MSAAQRAWGGDDLRQVDHARPPVEASSLSLTGERSILSPRASHGDQTLADNGSCQPRILRAGCAPVREFGRASAHRELSLRPLLYRREDCVWSRPGPLYRRWNVPDQLTPRFCVPIAHRESSRSKQNALAHSGKRAHDDDRASGFKRAQLVSSGKDGQQLRKPLSVCERPRAYARACCDDRRRDRASRRCRDLTASVPRSPGRDNV